MIRCLEVEFLSLPASCVAVSSICSAALTSMCSTQADNNSRKLRLRCGCQCPWCALAPTVTEMVKCFPTFIEQKVHYRVHNSLPRANLPTIVKQYQQYVSFWQNSLKQRVCQSFSNIITTDTFQEIYFCSAQLLTAKD
jgi:hypothetical protein